MLFVARPQKKINKTKGMKAKEAMQTSSNRANKLLYVHAMKNVILVTHVVKAIYRRSRMAGNHDSRLFSSRPRR